MWIFIGPSIHENDDDRLCFIIFGFYKFRKCWNFEKSLNIRCIIVSCRWWMFTTSNWYVRRFTVTGSFFPPEAFFLYMQTPAYTEGISLWCSATTQSWSAGQLDTPCASILGTDFPLLVVQEELYPYRIVKKLKTWSGPNKDASDSRFLIVEVQNSPSTWNICKSDWGFLSLTGTVRTWRQNQVELEYHSKMFQAKEMANDVL